MSKCDHGLTARLPVCALCADELEISRDEWEKRWREEAVRNTQLRRELEEARGLLRWCRPFAPNDGLIRDRIDAWLEKHK